MTTLTAIAGGIGAGKSVVARLVRTLGYPVYACDERARILTDTSPLILDTIAADIAPKAVTDGRLNRALLADIVFADADKLARLNALIHSAVFHDLTAWQASLTALRAFVESAITASSGLWRYVADAWVVDAPEPLRLARAVARGGLTEQQARARMLSQQRTERFPDGFPRYTILNDGIHPLIPQVEALL